MDTDFKITQESLMITSSEDCERALLKIKDAVIGSNRQKGLFIKQGFVPIILDLCCDNNASWYIRINALTVLGSLARGSAEQVNILVNDCNTIQVLIKQILLNNNDKKIIELCLSTLRSIFDNSVAKMDVYFADAFTMSHLLSLASPESSVQTQVSIASLLVSLCQSFKDQMLLFQAGTIPTLARMICSTFENLQLPALRSLASMCYENRTISDNICVTSFRGKSLPDILTIMTSRLFNAEIQLTASRCLTYIYRSGTLPQSDNRLVYKALPCLARLCTDDYTQSTRASAAETIAYFIEVDSDLQRIAAISNNLLKHLSQLLQESEPLLKKASFRCYGSLAANDEDIRKKILETNGLIEALIESLCNTDFQVRLASVRCLHSLSRSVQQLRTTFQDYAVWKTLMTLLSNEMSNDKMDEISTEMLIVITSIMCNLLLEFSPSKEPMLNSGIVETLCEFTKHKDSSLRLNGIWAMMNIAYQSNQQVKTKIINTIGTDTILKLLCDTDCKIVMKTLGLLRNLLSKSMHVDYIMSLHSVDVMKAVNLVLDSDHSSEIKEQALCIIGNIASAAKERDYIMDDEYIMARLGELLYHNDSKLQAGALFVISNIIHRKDSWSKERYIRLVKFKIIQSLLELNRKVNAGNVCYEDYINQTLKDIVMECKNFCSNVVN